LGNSEQSFDCHSGALRFEPHDLLVLDRSSRGRLAAGYGGSHFGESTILASGEDLLHGIDEIPDPPGIETSPRQP
jgi:hypothetical protein